MVSIVAALLAEARINLPLSVHELIEAAVVLGGCAAIIGWLNANAPALYQEERRMGDSHLASAHITVYHSRSTLFSAQSQPQKSGSGAEPATPIPASRSVR